MFNIFKKKKENKDMEDFIDFYSGEGYWLLTISYKKL